MPDFFPDFMRTATEHVIPKDPYPNHYIFHHNIRKRKLHPKNCRSNNKVWMVPISMINFFFFFYAFSVILLINCILKLIKIGIRTKKLDKTNPKKSHPLLPDLPEVLEWNEMRRKPNCKMEIPQVEIPKHRLPSCHITQWVEIW